VIYRDSATRGARADRASDNWMVWRWDQADPLGLI
jgi:hypothetical protein